MQLHNILITNGTIVSLSADTLPHNSVFKTEGKKVTAELVEYLKATQIPRGTGINLVFDQKYIHYQHFSFPLLSGRKIRQIIQFELDDTLLKEAENYIYSHSSQSFKDIGTTEAGVYIMEKDLLDELVSIFKEFNLELRWVTSLENLMDLTFRENTAPGNRIHIELPGEEKIARLFVYRTGFLVGLSTVSAHPTEETMSQDFLDQINQRANAIRLMEADICDISIQGAQSDNININEQQELLIDTKSQSNPTKGNIKPGQSIPAARLDHPERINLITSNFLVIQELKKHAQSLMYVAGVFLLSLMLYISALAYRGYHDSQYYEKLNHQLDQTIEKYLPKGASKANAVYIIKEQVQNLNLEKEKNRRFKHRNYRVSKALTELSLLKLDVPSLTLSRFSLNDQSIRFQGHTASISDFEILQAALSRLYPPDGYRINTYEKNRGSETVEFSTTIQFKPSK